MSSKPNNVMVGAFVLVLGTALIWGILWNSAGGPPQRNDLYIVYMLESVSGLNVDSSLKYRGVDVGKVSEISIDPENPERIRLLLQVQQGTPISKDTVATLEYQGLTGIANINLSGGNAQSAPLDPAPAEDYPVIATRPSLFLRLDTMMSELLENLTMTSANINKTLNSENRESFTRTMTNVATITGTIAGQVDDIDRTIASLAATLEHTQTASAALPGLLQQFSRSANSIAAMADQIKVIGDSAAIVSDDLQRTVNLSGADLTHFTSTTLPDISATVSELRLAAENMRRMSETLNENPSVLLYGNPPPEHGPGEEPQ